MFSVLSDKGKKRIYDAGMLGFLGDDDDKVSLFLNHVFSSNIHFVLENYFMYYNMDVELTIGIWKQGFCDFMQEMVLMMENVRSKVISYFCLMTDHQCLC